MRHRTLSHSPRSELGTPGAGIETACPKTQKFSRKQLALVFLIAAISDVTGAFAAPAPPIVWVLDIGTALLLFTVLGWQWLLLPGLALEGTSNNDVFDA